MNNNTSSFKIKLERKCSGCSTNESCNTNVAADSCEVDTSIADNNNSIENSWHINTNNVNLAAALSTSTISLNAMPRNSSSSSLLQPICNRSCSSLSPQLEQQQNLVCGSTTQLSLAAAMLALQKQQQILPTKITNSQQTCSCASSINVPDDLTTKDTFSSCCCATTTSTSVLPETITKISKENDDEMFFVNNNKPLIAENFAKFELPIPYPQPSNFNIQFICETASRLLFLSVHWIKNVPSLASRYLI